MNRKYNIQLNLSPYRNYYEDGGNMGGMVYTPDENGFVRGSLSTNWTPQGISPNNVVLNDEQQDMVKSAERKQTAREKAQNFIDNMNGGGASGWNAIGPAAANISNAFLDTESDLADRTAAAMGMPALASIWKADWKKGNEALTDYRNKLNNIKKNSFIQDANSSWGAANAVKLNSKPIAPITPQSQLLTWKDFRGNMFMKGAGAVAQGAASGSVGGPWGALGGVITGLFGSLFGGIGAKKRAKSAYNSYLNKWQTLNSANQAAFNKAVTDQTLSNMQALANGNLSQRINDMANIRAYGGNLYPDGGELTDEQQTILADIQDNPRILFTPEYSQWRDYIRRISPDYLDRLYTSLPYEQQQDIYQNDREAWGALSNETKGNFGGTQVRKKTDEVSPYVAGALGLVGAAPAMEAVTMFPMLENGLNAYFGYEGVKNLPTAVTDAYDYAKEGDWSRAGLSVGEAALDALFLGQGLKGIRGISNTIKSKPSTETMEFYHGGLDSDFDFNNLDVLKLAEKQAKKGKDYAGFYMYDPSLKMGAYKYGEGIGAHKINIDRNAKVLDLGDVERVPRTEIQKYKDLGYDMLTGKDVRGRREYVLLNKDAIKNTEYISPEIIDKELSSIKDTPRIRFKDRLSNDTPYMSNTSSEISNNDWDNAYNAAIKSNDIEKAQRLRDAHFLENAGRGAITKEGHPETIYHSVSPQYNHNFDSFNTKIEGEDTFVYTTNNKNMSRSYTKGKEIDKNGNMLENEHSGMSEKQLKEAIKSEEAIIEHQLSLPKDKQNSAYIKNVQSSLERHRKELHNVKNKVFENYNADNLSTTKSLYGKLDNPWIIEGGYNSWGHIPTDPYGEMSTRDIERTIRHFNSMGDHRDGAIIKDIADWGSTYLRPESDVFTLNTVNPTVKPNPDFYGTVYSFENPQNLKYRDVITYDNAGNIIPLSKRDNFNINDFRYGLAPLLGLTGYGLVNNTKAMGGNLYTDLSPNMMSLWNNKQQIDKQKTMNQQFSLGLGNTAFNKFDFGGSFNPINTEKETEIPSTTAVNNVTPAIDSLSIASQLTPYQQAVLNGMSPLDFVTGRTREALDTTKEQANKDVNTTVNMMYGNRYGEADYGNRYVAGGPVNPPNEFMDRYHPDWGEYTPEYADLSYDDFMNIYGSAYGDEGDYLKYSPSEYNRYKYRKYLNYPNKNTFQNSYLFQPTYEELDKKYDDSDLPIYKDKDGQYYLKAGIGYNNTGSTNADLAKWMESNYDEYSRKVNPANGDIRLGLTKEEYDKYVLNRNDGNKRIEASKYDPKKHKGYIPVQDYNEWYKDEINRVKHELKTRAFTNEFYAGPEVADYNARNVNSAPYTPNEKALRARQRKQEAEKLVEEEWAKRAANTKTTLKPSANKVVANRQNSTPINNMTFQQMEDYYGQKQSPLLGEQYKNTWANGGIMPPNRPLTREEIDKLTQAEKEELAKKQAIRLYKELYAPSPALYDSREEDDEHTYNVLNRPDQNLYSSFDNIINLFKPSFNDYISNEKNKRKEAADKAQQHSGGAFSWANGGQMTSADVPDNMQYYANGGTHEENPYGGIQVGTDQQGTPNLAEEGEFRWNDFVFSDRINVDANLLSSFNLAPATKHQNKKAAKGKLSYADMAKKYAKRNKELENDPITKNSMEAFMQRLANAQEYQKKEAQLEAQKQNELQDYKTALNKQNNNPMYGNMKYNGMGNAATQQGVNAGVGVGTENPMSNADLSNVNRSGNEMMAAYGGNLFAIGGKDDPNPYEWTLDNLNARQVLTPWNDSFIGPTLGNNTNLNITPNTDNYRWGDIAANTPFYQNEGWGIDMRPTYMKVKNPNYNAPAVSTYATRDKNGNIVYDPNGKPFMSYPRTYEGMKSSNYPDTKVIGKTVDNYGFYLPSALSESSITPPITTSEIADNLNRLNINGYIPINPQGISANGVPYTGNIGATDTQNNLTGSTDVSNKVIDKTTSNTNSDAAIPSDAKEVPLYNTAGKYAQFGKGIVPMIWDWAGKTNTKYDPYYVDANRLEALANEGPALRTADTIGGYRAPDLMDAERLNNAARAEGLAQLQAAFNVANGNRGFAGVQSSQNNYNTQMGIGNNYAKTQEINNANRLQTDQFNNAINVANQNAINAMRQDNQRAEQTQHQLAVSGTAQAANLRQNENFHADTVNTERMKNRAANQAAYTDNALNFFTTQAMENQELNARNNDPTNPYWIDKKGRVHYTGDSGLTQAVRDAFGNDEYGRNGTFTGERLTEWNDLIKNKKYSAKYLKEHPELWEHLVAQQREANRIDAEKAKQAKMEELEALRGTYQSNLARLDALRNSGAIISDPSYNLYAGWADEDYSGNQGLLRNRNQALDQYITQIGNNYDRYLYDKQLAQNAAKALGGYLNPSQGNNNNYYSYTRI